MIGALVFGILALTACGGSAKPSSQPRASTNPTTTPSSGQVCAVQTESLTWVGDPKHPGTLPPNWQKLTDAQLLKLGWRNNHPSTTSACHPGY